MTKRIVWLLLAAATAASLYIFAPAPAQAAAWDADGRVFAAADQKTALSAPKLTGVSNAADGVKVTWDAVSGAAYYRVFYKTGSGGWKQAGDTDGASYTVTGLKSGTKYTFTVRCLTADRSGYASGFDTTGRTITYVAAPSVKLAAADNGIKVSWNAVAGAAKYRVYYREEGGSWKAIGHTEKTEYTWKKAVSGKTYQFAVRCTDANKRLLGSYTPSASLTFLSMPKLKGASNAATGVKVTWGAVSGAELYRVYYKAPGGSWKRAGDTASASYTVTGLKSGTKYAFTVRCISTDGKRFLSSYDGAGKSVLYIAAPKIGSLTNTSSGVTVTWGAVSGAEKYRVYCKTGSGGWKKTADTTDTSCTVTGLKHGADYSFTVRCLDRSGKSFLSGYDTAGKTVRYLAAPTVKAANLPNGIKVSWNAVAGAERYRVYFKAKGSGGWNLIDEIDATSCVWNDPVLDMSYSFTVRAVGNGSVGPYKGSAYLTYAPMSAATSTDT